MFFQIKAKACENIFPGIQSIFRGKFFEHNTEFDRKSDYSRSPVTSRQPNTDGPVCSRTRQNSSQKKKHSIG